MVWEDIYRPILTKGLTTPPMIDTFTQVIDNTTSEYFEDWAKKGSVRNSRKL